MRKVEESGFKRYGERSYDKGTKSSSTVQPDISNTKPINSPLFEARYSGPMNKGFGIKTVGAIARIFPKGEWIRLRDESEAKSTCKIRHFEVRFRS